jgi:hypothetical protein
MGDMMSGKGGSNKGGMMGGMGGSSKGGIMSSGMTG